MKLSFQTFDFASGQKTVLGLFLALHPLLVGVLGIELPVELLTEAVSSLFLSLSSGVQFLGAVLAIYGAVLKAFKLSR